MQVLNNHYNVHCAFVETLTTLLKHYYNVLYVFVEDHYNALFACVEELLPRTDCIS